MPSGVISYSGPYDHGDHARLDITNLHHALKAYRERKGDWPPEDRWREALVDAGRRSKEQRP